MSGVGKKYPINNASVVVTWEEDGKVKTLTAPSVNGYFNFEAKYQSLGDTLSITPTYERAWLDLTMEKNERGVFCTVKEKRIKPERFTEIKVVKVIVPSLSAENVALAATQAGVEASAAFDVEPSAGNFLLTFTGPFKEV